MTVREQAESIQKYLLHKHNEFAAIQTEYNDQVAKNHIKADEIKAKYKAINADIEEQMRMLSSFRQVGENNTSVRCSAENQNPVKPDKGYYMQLYSQINLGNPEDYYAKKLVEAVAQGEAYLIRMKNGLAEKEKEEIAIASKSETAVGPELNQKLKQLGKELSSYFAGENIKNFVKLCNKVNSFYEITPDFLADFPHKMDVASLLIGYSDFWLDVPKMAIPVMQNALKHNFDSETKSIHNPCSITPGKTKIVNIEYIVKNESEVYGGVQALLMNILRFNPDGSFRITLLDTLYYNSSILGELQEISAIPRGCVEGSPSGPEAIQKKITLLADQYRQIEGKIGTQSVTEYNKTVQEKERIPRRLLIINHSWEGFSFSSDSDYLYLKNNTTRFGMLILDMKRTEKASYEDAKDKVKLQSDSNDVDIISDNQGTFYFYLGKQWNRFRFLKMPSLPDEIKDTLKDICTPPAVSEKYFDIYKDQYENWHPKRPDKRRELYLPFGIDREDNIVYMDFSNTLFSAYIEGASGSGKSSLFHTLISGILLDYHPDEIELWLLDFKKIEFKRYMDHCPPHVKYILLERSEDLVFDIVDQMTAELRRREQIFAKYGWHNLKDVPIEQYMPRIVIMIDEFAQMSQILAETKGMGVKKDYTLKIENLLAKGRALGFHFIFASQSYSAGIKGLTENAKNQIGTRVAMMNTYEEIKECLNIPNSEITPVLQEDMANLPKFYSIYRFTTKLGVQDKITAVRVRNLFAEDHKVDKLADLVRDTMVITDSKSPDQQTDYHCIDKKPILLEGNIPRSYESQLPYYLEYETPARMESLKAGDYLIYPGVPCTFTPALPFVLEREYDQNILVIEGDMESHASVLLSILKSARRAGLKLEYWIEKKSPLWAKYKKTLPQPNVIYSDISDICDRIRELRNDPEKTHEDNLIFVLGFEKLAKQMEIETGVNGDLDSEGRNKDVIAGMNRMLSRNIDGGTGAGSGPSMIKVLNAHYDSPEERNQAIEEFNEQVDKINAMNENSHDSHPAAETVSPEPQGTYDARQDLNYLLQKASTEGTHFCFSFMYRGDMKHAGIKGKNFIHKIGFPMSLESSIEMFSTKRAATMEEDCLLYTDSYRSYIMRPHLHEGIDLGIYHLTEDGDVVDTLGDEY